MVVAIFGWAYYLITFRMCSNDEINYGAQNLSDCICEFNGILH